MPSSEHGNVRTDLAADPGPAEGEETVELQVRTGYGDISIHRLRLLTPGKTEMTKGKTMAIAIETEGLRKSFGDQLVLDSIDLEVPRGGVFALLGPNGAGKTTMVHILSTLLRPDGGTAWVAGHDVVEEPRPSGPQLA